MSPWLFCKGMVFPECLVAKSPEIMAQEPCAQSCSGKRPWSMVQVSLLVDLPWFCCPRGCSLELAARPYHELSIHPAAGGPWGDPCKGSCTGNAWRSSARAPRRAEGSMRDRAMGCSRGSFWTEENRTGKEILASRGLHPSVC